MYSQNDEEEFILKTFGSYRGRFLDIGAFDNITFSNTRKLQELGWSGVLVEPDPRNICKILETIGPNVEVVCAAVWRSAETVRIYMEDYPDRSWASTINSDDVKAGNIRNPKLTPVWISTVTPSWLSIRGPYDFINVDAEWVDFEILRSTPDKMLKTCKLLSIEPRGLAERAEMKHWFSSNTGFQVAHETPENLMMIQP